MKTRLLPSLAGAVLIACGTGAVGSGRGLVQQEPVRTVILVRHAEKVDESADPELSETGSARASELMRVLADASVDAILVSPLRRTRDTAMPLAEAIGVMPRVVKQGATGNEEVLAGVRATPDGSTVLIVGHSNTLGPIMEGLGAEPIDSFEAYDNLVVATLVGERAVSVTRLRYGATSP